MSVNKYIDKGSYYDMTVNNSGVVFKISKEDYDFAKSRRWWSYSKVVNGNEFHYLMTKNYKEKTDMGNYKSQRFHKLIMQHEIEKIHKEQPYIKAIIVDHINGNTADNRRCNLRVRTQSENNMNKTIQSNNTSGVVGVTWHSKDKLWNANISYKNKRINLGSFYYMRNAVIKRLKAEEYYFGEHSFIKRSKEYQKVINDILLLPPKEEPVLYNVCPVNVKIKNNQIDVLWKCIATCSSEKIQIIKALKTEEQAISVLNDIINIYPHKQFIHKLNKQERVV